MNWLLRWLYRRLEAIRAEELQRERESVLRKFEFSAVATLTIDAENDVVAWARFR